MIEFLIYVLGYIGLAILGLAGLGLLSMAWDRILGGWWGPY